MIRCRLVEGSPTLASLACWLTACRRAVMAGPTSFAWLIVFAWLMGIGPAAAIAELQAQAAEPSAGQAGDARNEAVPADDAAEAEGTTPAAPAAAPRPTRGQPNAAEGAELYIPGEEVFVGVLIVAFVGATLLIGSNRSRAAVSESAAIADGTPAAAADGTSAAAPRVAPTPADPELAPSMDADRAP